ncbi:hypothetical protein IQ289_25500 [Burkholderia sp. R-70006]|nr:hypothetical protein [Burkholderia sp. R-70006]
MVLGAGVAWASCGGTEALVTSAASSLSGALAAQVGSAGAQLTAFDEQQTQRLLGAIKVLTEQVSVSAQGSDRSVLQAEQAAASVEVDRANKKMIDKTIEDYSSQGYNPCAQLTATTAMANAEASARASVPVRIQSEIQAGGGKYADPGATLRQREQLHRSLFCTQADVDAGTCSSLGAIPGGDSNASLIFSTDTSANALAAKNAAINNIIGLPDAPLPASMANTAEGAAYVMAKKEKDGFLAFPAYSLKSIQADAEGFDSFISERVGQYFGTAAAQSWAQDQASESERGILVDIVRIQGLKLKLGERQLRQDLRKEANDAALLLVENNQINGAKTDAAAARALASQATLKVAQ